MQVFIVLLCRQDLVALQTELAEAVMLRQKQEETLHMRERELTALKGALKDEVAAHDREMEALREQYGRNMEALQKSMAHVSQVCVSACVHVHSF